MERVRPKKKTTPPAEAPEPATERRAAATKTLRRDLAEQPSISLTGYGEPCIADKVGPVALSYREQPYNAGSKTRLYYVGRLLIGTACFSPLNIVVYLRGASATEYLQFQTEKELHQQLALLLKATP